MKKLFFYIAFVLFLFWINIYALEPPEIGGEIDRIQSFEIDGLFDGTANTWTRTRFRLKLDHYINNKSHAHIDLKMFTTDESNFGWKLSEAYIDIYIKAFNFFDVDLRSGVQQISWGSAYQINPTDNINPFDISEQGTLLPDEKLGVSALRLKFYPSSNLIFTGVMIPYFVPANEDSSSIIPEKTLENSEQAFKLTAQSIYGCDLSVSYFKGKEDYPDETGHYQNVNIYGGDIIGTIGGMALWVEGAYSEPEFNDPYFQIIAGGEYAFDNDLYFMSQFYHRNYFEQKEYYLMNVLRYPFLDIHELQLGMLYEIENEVFAFFPELDFSLAEDVSLILSGIFIEEDVEGTLTAQMSDKIFLKVGYCF
jgi:hypothetical protein